MRAAGWFKKSRATIQALQNFGPNACWFFGSLKAEGQGGNHAGDSEEHKNVIRLVTYVMTGHMSRCLSNVTVTGLQNTGRDAQARAGVRGPGQIIGAFAEERANGVADYLEEVLGSMFATALPADEKLKKWLRTGAVQVRNTLGEEWWRKNHMSVLSMWRRDWESGQVCVREPPQLPVIPLDADPESSEWAMFRMVYDTEPSLCRIFVLSCKDLQDAHPWVTQFSSIEHTLHQTREWKGYLAVQGAGAGTPAWNSSTSKELIETGSQVLVVDCIAHPHEKLTEAQWKMVIAFTAPGAPLPSASKGHKQRQHLILLITGGLTTGIRGLAGAEVWHATVGESPCVWDFPYKVPTSKPIVGNCGLVTGPLVNPTADLALWQETGYTQALDIGPPFTVAAKHLMMDGIRLAAAYNQQRAARMAAGQTPNFI